MCVCVCDLLVIICCVIRMEIVDWRDGHIGIRLHEIMEYASSSLFSSLSLSSQTWNCCLCRCVFLLIKKLTFTIPFPKKLFVGFNGVILSICKVLIDHPKCEALQLHGQHTLESIQKRIPQVRIPSLTHSPPSSFWSHFFFLYVCRQRKLPYIYNVITVL